MLKWQDGKGLEALSIELVNQNSISGTAHEVGMAKKIYELLQSIEYFQKHPQNLFMEPLHNDPLDRSFVSALVQGKGNSKDTLILLGHMDTVDIQDFGVLQKYAFDPYEYTNRLDPESLPEDAKKDLLSKKWLFGRGIMDMKCGVAMQMAVLEEYSAREDFDGNLLFIVVPDEESNSTGILAGIPFLNRLIAERSLNPLTVLNCEPNFGAYPGDDNKYVYLGTAGKLLPGFYFVGKECHVGESLAGVNANLIAAEFMRRLDVNTELSDAVDGEVTVPPTCLKYKDLKLLYSAQTPVASVAYYNLQTLRMSPKQALDKFRLLAEEAIGAAVERVRVEGEKYKALSGLPVKSIRFQPKVLFFSELYDIAVEAHGATFVKHLEGCIKEWKNDKTMDERDLNTRIVTEVHDFCPIREPMMVMFFSPPYYPHVGLRGESPFEKHLINVTDRLIEKARTDFGETLYKQKYFQGLSDLSYFALQDDKEVVEYLKPNMPSWGCRYSIPVEEIKKLNLPVLNFGPHGRDPHKFTERLLKDYSYDVAPKLLRFLINEIFDF